MLRSRLRPFVLGPLMTFLQAALDLKKEDIKDRFAGMLGTGAVQVAGAKATLVQQDADVKQETIVGVASSPLFG